MLPVKELTKYEKTEQQHIKSVFTSMVQDGKIDSNISAVICRQRPDWQFEQAMIQDGCRGKSVTVNKIVCFEDDPTVFQKKREHISYRNIYIYPMDYYAGSKFLQDQSDQKFNMIWLDFNSVPKFEHITNIIDIFQKLINSSKCLMIISFNVELKKNQTIANVTSEIIEKAALHDRFRYQSENVTHIKDQVKEAIELGMSTSEIFIPLMMNLLNTLSPGIAKSLCYSNFDDDETHRMTMMFSLNQIPNYVKGLQYSIESLFYRSNIETPSSQLLPRVLNNILPTDDETETQEVQKTYSFGRKTVGRIDWRKTFNNCPVNKYVFIRSIVRKSKRVSMNRVVAKRSSPHSKLFVDTSGKKYKASMWSPLVEYLWLTTNENLRHRVMNHNQTQG